MRDKTNKFLISIILLFIAITFTAMTASADCSGFDDLECVVVGGYELSIVKKDGFFPDQLIDADGKYYSNFEYKLVPIDTSKNVSTIDMLIPVCSDDFNGDGSVDNTLAVYSGYPEGYTTYVDGEGSSSTNFGTGVLQYFVFEQNFDSATTFYLDTTLASSGPTSVGLKIGNKLYNAEILGPACYKPQVASVVKQDIELEPLKNRTLSIETDPTGKILDVSFNGTSEEYQALNSLYVCAGSFTGDASSGTCSGDGFLPITYMPDGVARFGENTCYYYFIQNRAYKKCY